MTYFKVYGVPDYTSGKHIRGADHFEIEDGVLVFYETAGPHEADSVSLGDVAEENGWAVAAFQHWDWVEETE